MPETEYCECGCGGTPTRGCRFIRGHNKRGPVRGAYRTQGRWYIRHRNGSGTPFYRAVMEAHLKRPLRSDEIVHHINGDSEDDRIENLQLFASHREHLEEHLRTRSRSKGWYIAQLVAWRARHGHWPTRRELDRDPAMPSHRPYTKRFGSWSAAIKEAETSCPS